MVKLAVYSIDSSKNDKDLKKEEKLLEKEPIKLLESHHSIKVVPIDDGVAFNAVGGEDGCCCTRRRALFVFLLLSLLVLLVGTVGFIGIEFLGHEEAGKQTDFKATVDIDVLAPDQNVGGEGDRTTARPHSPEQEPPIKTPTTTPLGAQPTTPHMTHIHEDIDISFENNTEYFDIPENAFCERILIIYDFDFDKTAYRLIDTGMCFVKDLDLDVMTPREFRQWLSNPQNLLDQFETVKAEYVAVEPALVDLSPFGPAISYFCGSVPTYWLIPMPEGELTDGTTSAPMDDVTMDSDMEHHHGRKRRDGSIKKTVRFPYIDGPQSKEVQIHYWGS